MVARSHAQAIAPRASLPPIPEDAARRAPEPPAAESTERHRWESPSVLRRIGRLAVRWSLDHPDLREDLFQEGWLAAWQAELRSPDAPSSHLVRAAEERMRHVRGLGRSVDGKPDARHDRPVVYEVLRLDAAPTAGGPGARPLGDVVPSRVPDVAREVCGLLHAAAFLAELPGLDRHILGLRVEGYKWSEMTTLLRLQPRALHARRAALRESAARHWDPAGDEGLGRPSSSGDELVRSHPAPPREVGTATASDDGIDPPVDRQSSGKDLPAHDLDRGRPVVEPAWLLPGRPHALREDRPSPASNADRPDRVAGR